MTPQLDVSRQQQEALDSLFSWWEGRDGEAYEPFILAGYAGTGKTTIARHIPEVLGVDTLYVAFSGKAVHVLRTKGCEPAHTLHSMLYRPQRSKEGKLEFFLKEVPELGEYGLVIVDEVSMIGDKLGRDLTQHEVPVIAIGDPAQLPPVKDDAFFDLKKPDAALTEIHRQAAGSPVLQMATAVRQGKRLPFSSTTQLESPDHAATFQVLTGTNKERLKKNKQIRQILGYTSPLPQAGEKIMILANNRGLMVYHGQQLTVKGVVSTTKDTMRALVEDETGMERVLDFMTCGFKDLEGEQIAARLCYRGTLAAATFSYALTVHKAQGSQWKDVIIVNESRKLPRGVDSRRWLYTAITRAEENVVIVDPSK